MFCVTWLSFLSPYTLDIPLNPYAQFLAHVNSQQHLEFVLWGHWHPFLYSFPSPLSCQIVLHLEPCGGAGMLVFNSGETASCDILCNSCLKLVETVPLSHPSVSFHILLPVSFAFASFVWVFFSFFFVSARVRFFMNIHDWILKSKGNQKRILHFFTRQINPRYFGPWGVKRTEKSTSSGFLWHHDPRDLGLICLVKKPKIHFRILSDLKIQSWIFLKKCTLSLN